MFIDGSMTLKTPLLMQKALHLKGAIRWID